MVLAAIFLIILGLNNLGLLYLDTILKAEGQEKTSFFTQITAIILGASLGIVWPGPSGEGVLNAIFSSSFSLIGYLSGLTLIFFLLSIIINTFFNIFTRFRKIKAILLNAAAIIFIFIGFAMLLGKCPLLN